MSVAADFERAAESGQPLRVHLIDGEVAVVRVRHLEGVEVTFDVLRSSRPERYAFCDSLGYQLEIASVERTKLLTESALESFGRRRSGPRAARRRGAKS